MIDGTHPVVEVRAGGTVAAHRRSDMEKNNDTHLDDTKDVADEPVHSDAGELTPPHGDELRSEETFGRSDRYSNIDDASAKREREREA